MLVKATDLLNQKVMTIEEGKEVNEVKDLIYDPHENKVKAVLVDDGGWFADAKVILFEDLKGVGHDVVMIDSANQVKKASEVGEPVANIAKGDTHLTSTQVVTKSGVKLGTVTDLMFDPMTGMVRELEVSEGLVGDVQSGKKRVSVDQIVSIGKDATIVEAGAEEEFDEQSQNQGVQGVINAGQSKAQDIWQTTQQTAGQVKDQAGQRMEQTQQHFNDPETQARMQQQKDDLAAKASSIGETLGQKAEQVVRATEQKIGELTSNTKQKVSQTQEQMQTQRQQDAVGKYLTVNVLGPTDEMIGRRGDMVTNEMMDHAKQHGLESQIVGNVSEQPVS